MSQSFSSLRLICRFLATVVLSFFLACVAASGEIVNPSGIVLGESATFKMDIQPAAFPDELIHWVAEPATRVSFPSGSAGRSILVRGEEPGDVVLRVEIAGYRGEHPICNARVLPRTTVKADAWIVRKGDVWARTEEEVRGLFRAANDILAQVGVEMSLDSISSTNRPDWFDLEDPPGVLHLANQIASVTNGTGGLVFYFVGDIPGYRGLHSEGDILIKRNGTGATLAHEACHAFGLPDIYAWDDESPLVLDPCMPLRRSRMPRDWGSDSERGFYSPALTQSNVVERLLMFGGGGTDGIDIPRGDIWGVWYERTAEPATGRRVKSWHESLAPVGFFEHADTTPYRK